MILIIDNYDSFVHNLARYIAKLGTQAQVVRNDKVTVEEVKALKAEGIILSPGPCAPRDAGICIELVQKLGAHMPILGVCLGHQAIGEAYGGKTVRAEKPVHGKSSAIEHDRTGLFHNVPTPLTVGRYHSLICDIEAATELTVTATSESDEIMAMNHKSYPVYGVQFHPESVLTPDGLDIVKNFVFLARDWHAEQGD